MFQYLLQNAWCLSFDASCSLDVHVCACLMLSMHTSHALKIAQHWCQNNLRVHCDCSCWTQWNPQVMASHVYAWEAITNIFHIVFLLYFERHLRTSPDGTRPIFATCSKVI